MQLNSAKHHWLVVAVGVVVGLVVAAGVTVFALQPSGAGPGSPVVNDGPNFYQTLHLLNGSVGNRSGGPWSLFSVIGLVTYAPFSPNVKGYFDLNRSVNACQSELNGQTVWNGTIPISNGTFNSGTAPFWQLAYYSAASNQVLIASISSGSVQVFSPIPLSSDCVRAWTDFIFSPGYWAGQIDQNGSLPINSAAAANAVWNRVGNYWFAHNAPVVEVLRLGPALFELSQDIPNGNWGFDFYGCGIADVSGIRNVSFAGVDRDGSYAGDLNGSTNCALLNYENPVSGPPLDYRFVFSAPSATLVGNSQRIELPFQNAIAYPNGTLTGDYNAWGLANWMVSMNLTTSSGQILPLGSSGCPSWTPSLTSCIADSSGWYVVLLSAGGEWQASYGATNNGPAWTVPVTAMVSHQQLVIVMPSSWNVTGDTLVLSATVSSSTVTGSVVF